MDTDNFSTIAVSVTYSDSYLKASISLFPLYIGDIVFIAPAPVAAPEGETAVAPTVTVTITLTKIEGLTVVVTSTSDSSVLSTLNIPSA